MSQNNGNNDQIPDGAYKAIIFNSFVKEIVGAIGSELILEIRVQEGEYSGHVIRDSLKMWHPDQKTVEIANRTLTSICRATGVMALEDSVQLHDKQMIIEVICGIENEGRQILYTNEALKRQNLERLQRQKIEQIRPCLPAAANDTSDEKSVSALQHLGTINAADVRTIGYAEIISGVYFLINEGEVVYVGQSKDVMSRVSAHRNTKGRRFDSAYFIKTDTGVIDEIERKYIKLFEPKYNVAFTKKWKGSRTKPRHQIVL